jgi:hypothetical protein
MKIEFFAGSEEIFNHVPYPKPAKNHIPIWYKQISPIKKENVKYNVDGDLEGLNVKSCVPFIDAMTAGYIQETWQEIRISKDNGTLTYGQPMTPNVIKARPKVNVEISSNYYPVEFVWQSPWRSKVPKGYSILITHPLNRLDLPFTTMTGFIDADHYYHTPIGNIPVFFHKDFDGTLPVGTPMYQIIPIKRDDWKSSQSKFNLLETEKRQREMSSYIWGRYRNFFHQKKNYS